MYTKKYEYIYLSGGRRDSLNKEEFWKMQQKNKMYERLK